MQKSTCRDARLYLSLTMYTYPVQRSSKDEEEKEMPSFFSSLSSGVATIATAIDAAPADDTKAPTKDSSKEETADETTGANRLFDARRTEKME